MPDKAVISHRGEKYEIGRGKRFYGIWAVGAPYDAPVDRWPENHDGWQQAWARFAAIEVPGTIAAVPRERKVLPGGLKLAAPLKPRAGGGGGLLLAGEGLLVLGVVLGLAGLFPDYEGSQSLLSQWEQVVPHLAYVIGWLVTAALVALSVARPSHAARLGALFGLGIGTVTFGLFLADIGQLNAGVSLGSGLVVSLLGWAACTAGSALALVANPGQAAPQAQPGQAQPGQAQPGQAQPGPVQEEQPQVAQPQVTQAQAGWPGPAGWQPQQPRPQASRPVRPTLAHAGPLALLVLAAIGTAASFAPSWDRYTIVSSVSNTSQTVTAGNAFDNPGLVIAGNVAVMVAIVAVAAVAALWRPARHGGWLLAGAIVPLAAEVVSAAIQAGQAPSPAIFGISAAQAAAAGLTITSGLTGAFWVFLVFVVSLLVSCAWLFTEPRHPAAPAFAASPWLPASQERSEADADGLVRDAGQDGPAAADDGAVPDGSAATASHGAEAAPTAPSAAASGPSVSETDIGNAPAVGHAPAASETPFANGEPAVSGAPAVGGPAVANGVGAAERDASAAEGGTSADSDAADSATALTDRGADAADRDAASAESAGWEDIDSTGHRR